MLTSLQIEHMAVIDRVELTPGQGFLVLSGETGAGKSIIIDAVNLALGERGSREVIRTGETKARVQALFTVDDPAVFTEHGIDCSDGEVLLSRELYHLCVSLQEGTNDDDLIEEEEEDVWIP